MLSREALDPQLPHLSSQVGNRGTVNCCNCARAEYCVHHVNTTLYGCRLKAASLAKIENTIQKKKKKIQIYSKVIAHFDSCCGCPLQKGLVMSRCFDKTTLTSNYLLFLSPSPALQTTPTPTTPCPSTAVASLSSTGPTSLLRGLSSSCGNWSRYWGNGNT